MLILTKSVLAVMISFLLSVCFGAFFVPFLKNRNASQRLSIYLKEKHKKKIGTPTMGGFIFIIPSFITLFILLVMGKIKISYNLLILVFTIIGYTFIGFIDDYLIIKRNNNKGLTERQKLFLQIFVATIFFYLFMKAGNEPLLWIHSLSIKYDIGWLYGLFILFVLVASSNAVNLTDGLDGLAGGLSLIAYLTFGVISWMAGWLEGYEEIAKAEKMAKEIGGYKHYTIDAKEEFANEYIARGIKANAEYEGYPLSTALARPLIAQKIIDIAKKEGATAIAHGCTGKGNDQFRFEAVILAMSDLDIIAPIRELNLTRTEEQAYAAENGIKLNSDKIYSIDENIWGRSIEGDILEDPANEPPEEIYAWTASAEDALDTPQKVSIEFEEGIPVAINGEMMPLIDIIKEANKIAGENGIGRVDTIENRMIGLKSRETYEVPGAKLLIAAHQALEELVLTTDELRFAEYMSTLYADLVYRALWQEPLREDIDQAIDHMQRRVSGEVTMKLFKGSIAPLTRESPFSLHSIEQITFEDKETDQREVEGMIKYHGLQAANYQKLNR